MAQQEPDAPIVVDDRAGGRFVVEQDGSVAELFYEVDGDRLILVHTGVPEQLGGRGIGGILVRAALARAAEEHLTVVPWCPFARTWLHDHPDVAASLSIDWDSAPS